jgi:transposase
MSNLYEQSEEQMRRLRPYFPKSHGVPRGDDRRVVGGIIFFNRNGLRWYDAPKVSAPPKTLYNRWKRWSDMEGAQQKAQEHFLHEADLDRRIRERLRAPPLAGLSGVPGRVGIKPDRERPPLAERGVVARP